MTATWGRSIGDVAVRALLHRVGMAVRVDVTILLAEAAHPVETVDAHLRHLTAELVAAKRGLAVMLADAALLQRREVQGQTEAAHWHARAERALQAGDAALARQALARKLQWQRVVAQYADAQTAQQRSLAQVHAAVARLEARGGDVRSAGAQLGRSDRMQAGTMAWQRTAWSDQDTVKAQFAKLELDQAMDALRRSTQDGE